MKQRQQPKKKKKMKKIQKKQILKIEKKKKNQKKNLKNIEQLRNECESLNFQINKNNKIIEGYQIELNVLNNYAEEYDSKMQAKLEENKDNENNNNDNNKELESPRKRRVPQQQLFEHLNKMIFLAAKR